MISATDSSCLSSEVLNNANAMAVVVAAGPPPLEINWRWDHAGYEETTLAMESRFESHNDP